MHIRIGALNPKIAMLDEILVWVRMHDGERITNRSPDINQIVNTLIHQADFIVKNDVWPHERRAWIAKHLLEASPSCFATGNRDQAIQGLRRAVEVNPSVTATNRRARRVFAKLFGAETSESIIHGVRSLFQ